MIYMKEMIKLLIDKGVFKLKNPNHSFHSNHPNHN